MDKAWEKYSLGDIIRLERRPVKIDNEQEYAEIGIFSFGRGIFHKQPRTGFEVGNKDLFLIKQGDFILQITFSWEGAVGLASEYEDGMYGSVRFPTFRVDEQKCYPPFLLNYFRTNDGRNQLIKISPGSAGRNRVLSLKRIPEVVVPLPPLDEQRRIVARIEALAARVNQALELRRQAMEEVQIFWKSSLNDKFQSKSKSLFTLEDVCAAIIDNLHSTPKYDGNNYPCVRSQDIGWGTVNYATALRVSDEEFNQRTSRGEPQTGDIIFVREGDVGRCAIVDGSQRFCLGQRVMMLRPNPIIVIAKYLMYQLISPPILEEQLRESMTGTTSRHLNIGKFRQIKFVIPPLDEQRRIVAYLDDLQSRVDALRRLQAESQRELEALLPSILDRAFKGEL
jgi:type I restriction enzyme S subunit